MLGRLVSTPTRVGLGGAALKRGGRRHGPPGDEGRSFDQEATSPLALGASPTGKGAWGIAQGTSLS